MDNSTPAEILIESSLSLPGCLLVAVGIALLLAVAEVAEAYRNKPQSPWRAVRHPWALPFYGLYAGLTALVGVVLHENGLFTPGWTAAVVLGLAGPSLFKSNLRLFRSISGREAAGANLERMVAGVQQFCFEQINRSLARERIKQKEKLAREDEQRLAERLRILYDDGEFQQIRELIEERRQSDPTGVRALMVELIESKDATVLDHPLPRE